MCPNIFSKASATIDLPLLIPLHKLHNINANDTPLRAPVAELHPSSDPNLHSSPCSLKNTPAGICIERFMIGRKGMQNRRPVHQCNYRGSISQIVNQTSPFNTPACTESASDTPPQHFTSKTLSSHMNSTRYPTGPPTPSPRPRTFR